MRRFYQAYQIQQTVSVKLSWSHYCELLSISDLDKRSFYEKEAVNSGWSIRELKQQISTSLYERLLLTEGRTNQEVFEEYLDISEFIPSVYYTSNPGLLLLYCRSVSPKVKAIS